MGCKYFPQFTFHGEHLFCFLPSRTNAQMSTFILSFKTVNIYEYMYIYKMVNRHEQFKVSRMSCVPNENSDLLLLNSYVLSLGM